MSNTRDVPDRISCLADQGQEDDMRNFTPGERIAMIWPLTVSAWAMRGKNIAGERLQRHVDCVRRRSS